jgi:hypothetical protein
MTSEAIVEVVLKDGTRVRAVKKGGAYIVESTGQAIPAGSIQSVASLLLG